MTPFSQANSLLPVAPRESRFPFRRGRRIEISIRWELWGEEAPEVRRASC